tara:strand:+ start:68 stop:760 length:693 start_codon:yes stop_codon:yes gene_type:complete
MQIINLFPLSLIKEKISLDIKNKEDMKNEILSMVKNSKNKGFKGPQDSWTGDTQGFEYIYKNNKFKTLFAEIKKKLINYLNHLGINHQEIDLYITRSWATVSNGEEKIKQHRHNQSHISFAYYLQKSTEDSNIVFFEEFYKNEIVKGIFRNQTLKNKGIIKKFNLFNAPSIDINVEEDDVLIFPSKSLHGTQMNKSNKERISISGDVVCVTKNSELLENMLPPLENWDKI